MDTGPDVVTGLPDKILSFIAGAAVGSTVQILNLFPHIFLNLAVTAAASPPHPVCKNTCDGISPFH